MTKKNDKIINNLNLLKQHIEEFKLFYKQDYNYSTKIYELWDAKDILGHITFWHESFARNISDVGRGIKPQPLKGKLSEVNQTSVESTKNVSIAELIIRLQSAQKTIEKYILNEHIDMIPYKKGSRNYSRKEHLEIVSNHIYRHLKDLKKRINERLHSNS